MLINAHIELSVSRSTYSATLSKTELGNHNHYR